MRWSTEAKVGAFALAGIVLFSGMMVVILFFLGTKGLMLPDILKMRKVLNRAAPFSMPALK